MGFFWGMGTTIILGIMVDITYNMTYNGVSTILTIFGTQPRLQWKFRSRHRLLPALRLPRQCSLQSTRPSIKLLVTLWEIVWNLWLIFFLVETITFCLVIHLLVESLAGCQRLGWHGRDQVWCQMLRDGDHVPMDWTNDGPTMDQRWPKVKTLERLKSLVLEKQKSVEAEAPTNRASWLHPRKLEHRGCLLSCLPIFTLKYQKCGLQSE